MSGDYHKRSPLSNKIYGWNWSSRLAVGEVITAAVVTVPAGLTKVGSETHDDTTVAVRVTGGTLGKVYDVTCRITTDLTNVDEATIHLETFQT